MRRTNLLRGNNARTYMQYLIDVKVPFTMQCSNYTILFESEGLERKFVHEMQSNRTFAAFSKLKSQLKNKPIPEIDKEKLSYFVHDFKESAYVGDVCNIDLKSAYATVLFRDGYINESCFDYLQGGTKQQRLASVGMLASKKQVFYYDNGKMIGTPDEIVSELSNFFFYAVKRTADIMADQRAITGNDYLFTWVDGIYFQPNNQAAEECEKYLDSIGFKSTTEWLREFEVTVTHKKITVSFLKKDKRGIWKVKTFNLPLPNTEFKRIMLQAILNRAA